MKLPKKIKIAVVSSFAEDEISYVESIETETRDGGPALWITTTLMTLGYAPLVFSGEHNAKVKIIRDKNKDSGSVTSVDPIVFPDMLKADLFIISTISDELNLNEINKMHGTVVLDIQGFVRKLKMTNKKLAIPQGVANKIAVLKGTEEEVLYLEKKFLDDQKSRILLVTKGEKGFSIFSSGICYEFTPKDISTGNTVGAGDSLLTAFAVELQNTNDILRAGEFGKKYVEEFLRLKNYENKL